MSEKNKEKENKLDKVVRSRIKGLGLDALFHQVDIRKKDEDPYKKKSEQSDQERDLLEKLKTNLRIQSPAKSMSKLRDMIEDIFSKGPKTKTILEIGTHAIKLIEIRNEKEKPALTKAVYIPIPHIVITSPEKLEEFIVESLKRNINVGSLKKTHISTIIPRSKVIVKTLTLPTTQAPEINKMLEFEAEHHLPFSLNQVEVDYHILKHQDNKTEVLLAAAKKEEITQHLSLLDKAGIKPDSIQVSSLVLYNSLRKLSPKEDVSLQVNIGAVYTDVNIVQNQSLLFTRGINWGSGSLTQSLSQELNVSLENADKIKKENGILLAEKQANQSQKTISQESCAWADKLISQIQRTIQHFHLERGDSIVKTILLTGGGSRLINLNEYLRQHLKLKAVLQKMPEDIEIWADSEVWRKYFYELAQLAGSSQDQDAIKINLLPSSIKYSLKRKKETLKQLVTAGSVMLAILVLILTPLSVLGMRSISIRRLDKKIALLKPQLAAVKDLKNKIATVEDYISTKQSSMEILREISLLVTSDITIDRFGFEKNQSVTLSGIASSHASVVNLSQALTESALFKNAKIRYSSKKDRLKEDVDFEIACEL